MWGWLSRRLHITPNLGERVGGVEDRLERLESWRLEREQFTRTRFSRLDGEILDVKHAVAQLTDELKKDREERGRRITLETDAVLHGFEAMALKLVRETVKLVREEGSGG